MRQVKNLPVTAAEAAQIAAKLRARGWKPAQAARISAARARADLLHIAAEEHGVSPETVLTAKVGR